MDPKRFRDSALLPLPLNDPKRPSPALLNAVHLLGARLSRLKTHESNYLSKSLQATKRNLLFRTKRGYFLTSSQESSSSARYVLVTCVWQRCGRGMTEA